MIKNKVFTFLALAAISLFVLSSCSEDTGTTPNTNGPKPSPASNLQATSISKDTIHLKYDISTSETNVRFQDYQLTWKEDATVDPGGSKIVLRGTNPIIVGGLVEGKIYLFTLVARYDNDSVSTPITVKWSPASRFTLNNNDDIIKVYETASGFGSGLQMFSAADGTPRVRTVANGADWDLGIRTEAGKIEVGSATKFTYNYTGTPKPTYIFKDKFLANSLNDVFDSRAMNDGTRNNEYTEQIFDIKNDQKSVVFYVRKIESGSLYTYAKVMAKYVGGSFLQGSSPNRYIEFEISYQKTAGVPYAKTSNNNPSN